MKAKWEKLWVKVNREINLKGEECPIPFVKSKLALEEMKLGEVLRIVLDYPPAAVSVPKSLEIQGDKVLSVEKINQTDWEIIVRKEFDMGE